MMTLADLLSAIQGGIAPYGLRYGSEMPKGKGYFGALPENGGGVSTEISAEQDGMQFPLMVPTLTQKELNHLLSGKEPTDAIYNKAMQWAETRKKMGRSPFATPQDIRMPRGLLQ